MSSIVIYRVFALVPLALAKILMALVSTNLRLTLEG